MAPPILEFLPLRLRRGAQLVLLALAACGGGAADAPLPGATSAATSVVPTAAEPGIGSTLALRSGTLDALRFGVDSSEQAHRLTTAFSAVQATQPPLPSAVSAGPASDVVLGARGQPARRLLPRTPNPDYYGGEVSFRMAVDPVQQNYLTLELWGSEVSSSWLLLNLDGMEVGGRHMTPDEGMLLNHGGWNLERFIHRSVRLPWHLTAGKTSVTITLRSLGRISYYTDSTQYDSYQKRMQEPSVGLYAAFLHTGPRPDEALLSQGRAPSPTGAAATAAELAAFVAKWKTDVDALLGKKLAAAPATLNADDLQFLAQSHGVAWTRAYRSAAAVSKVVAAFDAMVTAYAADPQTYFDGKFPNNGGNGGWGGYFGPVGDAVALLAPQIAPLLDASLDYGGTLGSSTRRDAWASALRASVDYGRSHRKSITNQDWDAAWRIVLANLGLRSIAPDQALPEGEALRHVYESIGLLPYMGSDAAGGGTAPIKGNAPYGPDWFMVTRRGTTKEGGLVGSDYGELGAQVFALAQRLGDRGLKARALEMLRARAALRYPDIDAGGRRVFRVPDLIGTRNDHDIGRRATYLAGGTVDDILVGSRGAAEVGADLLGALQQQWNDGQLLPALTQVSGGYAGRQGFAYLPDHLSAFLAQPATGRSLPMSAGQPDFAWVDEENLVVAAKQGEERFWANLYWRDTNAINRLARVFLSTPGEATVADVSVDDVQYRPTGADTLRDGKLDNTPPYGVVPPDKPLSANAGLVLPVALRPDLASVPATNRDGGRGTGYTLRYGRWLVAINNHPSASYTMLSPKGFSGGVDLVTGARFGASVTLARKSAAVFYLPASLPATVPPATPLRSNAVGVNGGVALAWDACPGAYGYTLQRSTPAGGFQTLAEGLPGPAYIDRTAEPGTSYRYRVLATAIDGTPGGPSPVATGSAGTGALPRPWINVDIGAVGLAGATLAEPASATASVTVSGAGADIGGSTDAMQFAALPLLGDGSLSVRVAVQQAGHPKAQAGIMIRESLGASARHTMLVLTPGSGAVFAIRGKTGGATSTVNALAGVQAPYWLRLERRGSVITGSISADGLRWTVVGSVSQALPGALHAGLAVSSHDTSRLSSTLFDNLGLPP